jgi:hypothetical protein
MHRRVLISKQSDSLTNGSRRRTSSSLYSCVCISLVRRASIPRLNRAHSPLYNPHSVQIVVLASFWEIQSIQHSFHQAIYNHCKIFFFWAKIFDLFTKYPYGSSTVEKPVSMIYVSNSCHIESFFVFCSGTVVSLCGKYAPFQNACLHNYRQ